jgi:subtilisin family serine protease
VAALIRLTAGTDGPPLLVIDAFHRTGNSDRADAFDVAQALDIAAQRGARVVNMSLAGPANEVLERAGRAVTERGLVVVASVGNDGPQAAPLYPAAYPWAIAVTAIDERDEVYRSANRGGHVDLAAPGVRIPVGDVRGRIRLRSGTSFAAPFVSLTLATYGAALRKAGNGQVEAGLSAITRDLGAPGADPVFGAGVPQVARLCAL